MFACHSELRGFFHVIPHYIVYSSLKYCQIMTWYDMTLLDSNIKVDCLWEEDNLSFLPCYFLFWWNWLLFLSESNLFLFRQFPPNFRDFLCPEKQYYKPDLLLHYEKLPETTTLMKTFILGRSTRNIRSFLIRMTQGDSSDVSIHFWDRQYKY